MMHVAVCTNSVSDPRLPVVPGVNGELAAASGPYRLDYDAGAATELAIRLREQHQIDCVTTLSAGGEDARDGVLTARAMGADESIWLRSGNAEPLDAIDTARVLANKLDTLKPEIVLTGCRSSDFRSGTVPAMVAELLGWTLMTRVIEIQVVANRQFHVSWFDDAQRRITANVPPRTIIACDAAMAEPRYVPSISKRKIESSIVTEDVSTTHGSPFIPIQFRPWQAPSPQQVFDTSKQPPEAIADSIVTILRSRMRKHG